MKYPDNKALISAYITSVGEKQFKELDNILAEDMQFKGPFMAFDSAAAYTGALQRLGPILLRNEIREIICDGTDNCVLYDLVAVNDGGIVPCLEWITITNEKVSGVKLLFDKALFTAVRKAALMQPENE